MSRDHFRPRTGRGLTKLQNYFFQPIRISYAHLFLNNIPILKSYKKVVKNAKKPVFGVPKFRSPQRLRT